jgi:hypothetical protein
MKMKSFTLLMIGLFFGMMVDAQTDTIVGWSFSDNTDMDFHPSVGLSGNMTYDIRAEDTLGGTRTLTYTNGASDFAATASGWDNGSNYKFWSIKFKANGYSNFKVSSKISSGGNNAGPKYWKLQCRTSSTAWVDIPGGVITVANDWTTGVVNQLPLPGSFDNPGSTSLFIRWIMTSNESVNGVDVLPAGIAKIDDIFVTAENSIGVETVLFESSLSVYPNPAAASIHIDASKMIEKVQIFDSKGTMVISELVQNSNVVLDVSNLPGGLYFVTSISDSGNAITTRKVMISR